jgi:hypothetical protein
MYPTNSARIVTNQNVDECAPLNTGVCVVASSPSGVAESPDSSAVTGGADATPHMTCECPPDSTGAFCQDPLRVLPLNTDVTLTLANGDWNYFVIDLVGRCRLTRVESYIKGAWCQLLKTLKYDEPLLNVAFNVNLRRYELSEAEGAAQAAIAAAANDPATAAAAAGRATAPRVVMVELLKIERNAFPLLYVKRGRGRRCCSSAPRYRMPSCLRSESSYRV